MLLSVSLMLWKYALQNGMKWNPEISLLPLISESFINITIYQKQSNPLFGIFPFDGKRIPHWRNSQSSLSPTWATKNTQRSERFSNNIKFSHGLRLKSHEKYWMGKHFNKKKLYLFVWDHRCQDQVTNVGEWWEKWIFLPSFHSFYTFCCSLIRNRFFVPLFILSIDLRLYNYFVTLDRQIILSSIEHVNLASFHEKATKNGAHFTFLLLLQSHLIDLYDGTHIVNTIKTFICREKGDNSRAHFPIRFQNKRATLAFEASRK